MGRKVSEDVMDIIWKREEYLEFLSNGGGPKTQKEIKKEFDLSDSMIYKRIKELEENGLVEDTKEGFEITLFGKTAFKRYKDLKRLCDFKEVLGEVSSEIEIDPRILEEGELILPKSPDPHRPVKYLKDIVKDHEEIKVLSPVVIPRYVEFFYDKVIDKELEMEAILTEEVVRYVFSEYHRKLTTALEYDNFNVRKTHEELPFGVFICGDEEICLIIYDSDGKINGLVHCDTENSVNWANNLYEQYNQDSEKVFLRYPSLEDLEIWKN